MPLIIDDDKLHFGRLTSFDIILDKLNEANARISPLLYDFANTMNTLQSIMTENEILINKFITFMLSIGWPPPLNLTIHQISLILAALDNTKSELIITEIENVLIQIYDEEKLSTKLNNWKNNKLLNHRLEIIDAVIHSHIFDNYWLSITAKTAR